MGNEINSSYRYIYICKFIMLIRLHLRLGPVKWIKRPSHKIDLQIPDPPVIWMVEGDSVVRLVIHVDQLRHFEVLLF